MTIVWDTSGPDLDRVAGGANSRLGAVAEHFIAIWGEPNGDAHAVFVHPAEWQPLADAIEQVLADFKPLRPIWEWPRVEPEEPHP